MEEKEILILILGSGEKLLANVRMGDGAYMCENTLQIFSDVDESTGQMRLGMMEYMPYAERGADLAIPTSMAAITIPNEDMRANFQKKFGLIITPPEQKIVLA